MPKRKNIFIMLGLLLVLLTATCSYVIYQTYHEAELKRQELVAARHHLFCEVLKPGMSMDEVFGILHQTGDFTVSSGVDKSPDAQLHIVFLDSKERDLYGGSFEIGFSNYKYDRAYERGFDTSETICDFSRATP
jgi:hypothetical protein